MIISDREHFVFIHNPKVAGMSFRTALAAYDTRDNFFFEWKWAVEGKTQIDMAHITPFQLRQHYRPVFNQVQTYFKFGFVRDPYTRFLSAVSEHLKLGSRHQRAAILRNPDLFYRVAEALAGEVLTQKVIDEDFKLSHFRRQSDFLCLDDEKWVDQIFHLETLAALDGTKVGKWLGNSHRIAKNQTLNFAAYGYELEALAPATRRRLEDFYAVDFERFDYRGLGDRT